MKESKIKKMDRRSRYTRMIIKDSLLELLSEKVFGDISVSELCRAAEISRGTFYLHYDNLRLVMDELFDDAVNIMHGDPVQVGYVLTEKEECYPLCRFLRENRKYRPLFFSDSLHSHVIDLIAESGWSSFAAVMKERTSLSEDVLKAIYLFQIHGYLAVIKRNIDIPDESWSEIQVHLDQFLNNGLLNL